VNNGSRHSVSILLRSLAIIVNVEAFGTCPLSLLRNANSSVRYVREKRRYTWSSSLLAVYERQGRTLNDAFHAPHQLFWSEQLCYTTYLHLSMGRVYLPA
jgi:hypothetical protein